MPFETVPTDAPPVGRLLKHWRQVRRKSQLTLSLEADVSPRHLGFIEVGRSKPSREMVLTLAKALDVPLRERNGLLLAAGFAPMYHETGLSEPAMAQARRALDSILRQQEPFPAVVMDRVLEHPAHQRRRAEVFWTVHRPRRRASASERPPTDVRSGQAAAVRSELGNGGRSVDPSRCIVKPLAAHQTAAPTRCSRSCCPIRASPALGRYQTSR